MDSEDREYYDLLEDVARMENELKEAKDKEYELQDKGISQIPDETKRIDSMKGLLKAEKIAIEEANGKSTSKRRELTNLMVKLAEEEFLAKLAAA